MRTVRTLTLFAGVGIGIIYIFHVYFAGTGHVWVVLIIRIHLELIIQPQEN